MKQSAIVTGSRGRLGRAFASRLSSDGFNVHGVEVGETQDRASTPGEQLYLFDLAYQHGDPDGHVDRVVGHLENWRRYEAIFVPSSLWIGADSPYGRAKLAVEHLAARYRALGARVVTDRIGYFPGDGIAPDPNEPFYEHRVTGDALYARVMARMRPSENATLNKLERLRSSRAASFPRPGIGHEIAKGDEAALDA
jgi:nucleoside-diphosphate-sugar epimerase